MSFEWKCVAKVAVIDGHILHVQRDFKAELPWFNARIDGVILGGAATEKGAQAVAEKFARQMFGGES